MRTMAPAGPGVPRAVTHGAQATSTEAWLDLVVAEDDWVRREFEEVVAAGWDGEVPSEQPTARGNGRPQGPQRHRRRWLVSEPATNAPRPPAGARERGPPPPRARQAHRSADYFSADHGSLPVEHVRAHVEGLLAPASRIPSSDHGTVVCAVAGGRPCGSRRTRASWRSGRSGRRPRRAGVVRCSTPSSSMTTWSPRSRIGPSGQRTTSGSEVRSVMTRHPSSSAPRRPSGPPGPGT